MLKKLKAIAKQYNMRVHFVDCVEFSGEYLMSNRLARIQKYMTKQEIISTFFHELGHHIDYNAGLFKKFYRINGSLQNMRRWALRAERHADRVGMKLCKKYFPKVKYMVSYKSKEDVDYLREYYP